MRGFKNKQDIFAECKKISAVDVARMCGIAV